MIDREVLLKKAREFEDTVDAEEQRDDQIRSILRSLRGEALRKVEDEARVRAMQYLETYEEKYRTADWYASKKRLLTHVIIGEWYIDQKKPLESRVAEQVEA